MQQPNQAIKLIIFDLDRTLFEGDEAQQLARNKLNQPAQRQYQKICRLALDHRVDAYYMSQENKSQSQKVPHFLTFFRTLLSTYKND
ncbi:hypothetical protein E0H80_02745 [Acinetobacter sp. ANC 4779]|uniref:hypothetical protein n=1 Tax=Acinetobacter sp. ANC 4779 TaxID=2529848 RepID=UPI00103D8CBE|nr:hypothetical protein [Acinetobacter sp. ANC 4779]TCB52769.1 hypothetical protein E0H80_02745 [Acinetobacter sp. ANC 4779]